jgi:CHASE2 domain-containing sensor protein
VRGALRTRRFSPDRMGALAVLGLLAFLPGAAAHATGFFEGLELKTLKVHFDLRGAERPGDVVVVAIDDESFGVLQEQWPFPRSLHGRAIRRLHSAGAREIVYDVQFTEPTEPREDFALYRAIGDAGGAVLATSESDGRGGTNVLGGDESLERVGARAAASDLHNDRTGTISRFPRAVAGLETLAVATAERVGGRAYSPSAFGDGGAWIDYRGPPGTIETVSFADLIRGHFAPGAFRDRVVVVGASAPTLRDVHATPVGGDELMAGAEVQANAVWTAIHGLPLRQASPAVGLLLVALLALVAPLVSMRLPALAAGLALPVVAVLFLAAAHLAFQTGLIVHVVPPLLALALGTAGTIAHSASTESRARRAIARDNELLEARVRERTNELWATQLEIVQRLGMAVELRDADTGFHIDRIGHACERLALAAGVDPENAELLRHASALHDVGKVGIPDAILMKPGKLDADEWETMKSHTTIGGSILADSSSKLVQLAHTIALTHHERWDGTGYPAGLRGEEIPLPGRICAVCDVFDALLSGRPYKEPWPIDDVIAGLERSRGTHFDPQLVDAFLPLARDLHREWFQQQEDAPPQAA